MIFNSGDTGDTGGYQIANSLRLRRAASAYLYRTAGAPTNQIKWTYSGWVKRGDLALFSTLISGGNTANDYSWYGFDNTDKFYIIHSISGVNQSDSGSVSTGLFRDPTAWYHVVINYDSANATASERTRLYVNGGRWTLSAFPSLNETSAVNANGVIQYIAQRGYSAIYNDCYLAELNFIDGQSLDASYFGQFDTNGVWAPKAYTGTYGNNGFYLKFNDGSSLTNLCLDRSGNGNNWTATNVSLTAGATYDWMVDTPTCNYATINPLATTTYPGTYANGNLQTTTPATGGGNTYATQALPASGKYYWEVLCLNANSSSYVGVSAYNPAENYAYQNTNSVHYNSPGQKYVDGTGTAYGSAMGSNALVGVAVDCDAGTITFYLNNVSQGAISHAVAGLFPCFSDGSSGAGEVGTFNFGQRPFTYTPPTGFKALCTANRGVGSITTSGTFTGNASADGPCIWLSGNPETMTINGNAVTWGTHADKLAGGFKVRTASASYNASGTNTYSVTVTGKLFGDLAHAPNTAKGNP